MHFYFLFHFFIFAFLNVGILVKVEIKVRLCCQFDDGREIYTSLFWKYTIIWGIFSHSQRVLWKNCHPHSTCLYLVKFPFFSCFGWNFMVLKVNCYLTCLFFGISYQTKLNSNVLHTMLHFKYDTDCNRSARKYLR